MRNILKVGREIRRCIVKGERERVIERDRSE